MDTAGILLSQPPPLVSACVWLCLSQKQGSIIKIFVTLRAN